MMLAEMGQWLGLLLTVYGLGVVVVLVGLRVMLLSDPKRDPQAKVWASLPREVIWGFWIELALIPLLWFWPRTWANAPLSAGQYPTLMIHGHAQTRVNFWVLGWRLRQRGRGALYSINYQSFEPIEQSAKTLARAAAQVLAATGASKLNVVAHSQGGLVSRYWIERMGGAAHVNALVMLGTPQRGTTRANLSVLPAGRQMRPGSAFLSELGAPKPPAGVTYRAVWSRADGIIMPAESAQLCGAGEELALDDHGHLQLLTSQQVAGVVGLWLDEAELSMSDAALHPEPQRA
jgi:triacylglycerol esterase/lipase EstA (alpha/beta hydrolase family)